MKNTLAKTIAILATVAWIMLWVGGLGYVIVLISHSSPSPPLYVTAIQVFGVVVLFIMALMAGTVGAWVGYYWIYCKLTGENLQQKWEREPKIESCFPYGC